MNTDTPEDIKFREAEQKRSRFDEMVKEVDVVDKRKTRYHVRYAEGMKV